MRIVYHAFQGRYSDNPRALHQALLRQGDDHEHVWLADPAHLHGFPEDAETVAFASSDAVDALESADLVIANTYTTLPWDKRPSTRYLQTWHGTPLKLLHHDCLWWPPGRRELLTRDVERWDVLLSPNPHTTRVLRGAFRFGGEVLETGYPRNDLLSAPERDEVRARVRAELGIPEGTRAVLYAPTWRDDRYFDPSADAVDLHLDLAAFTDALGDDHVLLLRLHYLLTGALGPVQGPAVRDVSYHPDVAELYLAADVLVTDYSSTMFDFAVTGRPQVFFAYDLEAYRREIRGFYFDLEPVAPGPVVQTMPELLRALRDLDPRAHAGRYADFRHRFCALEDGRAADRVLEHLGLAAPEAPLAGAGA